MRIAKPANPPFPLSGKGDFYTKKHNRPSSDLEKGRLLLDDHLPSAFTINLIAVRCSSFTETSAKEGLQQISI